MSKWVLDQWSNGPLDYPTLGFTAEAGDILDATAAPDARWSLNGDQGAAETVYRYTLGGDPNYVEPTNGHVLTYDATQNRYVPTAPETVGLPSLSAYIADLDNNPASDLRVQADARLSATYARSHGVVSLDSYTDFFAGDKWVTGQRTTNTTTTGAVSAGASVIPFADVTGVAAGFQFVTAEGTANQRIYTVASVASLNVTIVGTVGVALANGATIKPLWANSSHLNSYIAWATWMAAQQQDGTYVITGTTPKVTFLGNSWISQGGTSYATQLQARIPGATVVNAGVAGNNSAALLARFDTDVPADSDYVVFNEPGVNDDTGHVSQATQLANLAELVRKIRTIGATPIYTGHVPLADHVAYSAAMQEVTDAIVGDGKAFPGANVTAVGASLAFAPDVASLATGLDTLKAVTTGVQNTAYGAKVLAALTTGQNNTGVGREVMTGVTTGNSNTGVGHNALRNLTTGASNVAVGQACGSTLDVGAGNVMVGQNAALVLTGSSNVIIGNSAGYAAGGLTANATVGAGGQTCVGHQSGLGSATQANYITTLGHKATASGYGGFAIGTDQTGAGAASTGNDVGVLGTTAHTVKVPGRFNVATRTPTGSADAQGTTGDITWDADYVYVKTAAGWKRSALTAW